MAWCPQGRRFVRRNRQRPYFYLNWMAAQPTAVKILVDWEYAPEAAAAVARAKSSWDAPNVMITRVYIDDGPVGDPGANLRLYDFLKEQNQRASHFMIGTNIHENPERRSGNAMSIVIALASAPATSVNNKVTRTPIMVWPELLLFHSSSKIRNTGTRYRTQQ